MRLDDFLVLGRTVPEESQRYGMRVCMAGYSPEFGRLLRIYPLLIDNPLKSRHEATLDIQRNNLDNRIESFKLTDAVNGISRVSERPVVTVDVVGSLAEKLAYPSIEAMNLGRLSLGFVAIHGLPTLIWKTRRNHADEAQQELFDEFIHDLQVNRFLRPDDYPAIPYLQFRDDQGWHELQLREWGCYEHLRKHAFAPHGLAQALHLDRPSPDAWYALVGNMAHRRNAWLVIHLMRVKRETTLPLFL